MSSPQLPHRPHHRRRWYNPIAMAHSLFVRPKIFVSIAVAALVFWLTADHAKLAMRSVLAWNAGGFVYLMGVLRVAATCGEEKIRRRAARQDDSAIVILAIILVAIAASFAAIAGLLSQMRDFPADEKPWVLLLAGLTIAVSWAVTQAAFSLHYAHEFYAPTEHMRDADNGLVFPGDEKPDYWDFIYFAATIGAASQTSDVAVRSKSLRRLVTLHAIVAFFFNTMVLALMVNMATGLLAAN
jgi:uncharacterized membrane protein